MLQFIKKRWKKIVAWGAAGLLGTGLLLYAFPLTRYLLVQGYFQARIFFCRQPIEKLMLNPSLDGADRKTLHLVGEIRDFGISLGLHDTKSYRTVYDTGGGPVVYAVSACPPDSLEPFIWRFPIVGKVPYLGFFRKADAEKEVKKLQAKGLDVWIRPVSAYSTIGILPDPLFSSMLKWREEYLANTIIHEMTHETVFIKSDMNFNESLASFVGNQGSVEFLKHRYGEGSEKLQQSADLKHDEEVFSGFISGIYDKLKALYASDRSGEEKLAEKTRIFAEADKIFLQEVKPRLRTKAYDGFSKIPLNNAYMLVHHQYHGEYDIFKDLYELQGKDLKKTIEFLKSIKDQPGIRERIRQEVERLKAGPPDPHPK